MTATNIVPAVVAAPLQLDMDAAACRRAAARAAAMEPLPAGRGVICRRLQAPRKLGSDEKKAAPKAKAKTAPKAKANVKHGGKQVELKRSSKTSETKGLSQSRKCVVSRAYHQAKNAAMKRGALIDAAKHEARIAANLAGNQWDLARASEP